MSRSTSSRSTLTMVPSTMSPSLKYLIVLSIAARKSSLEPMSLTATCGEVTAGLGMLLGCSGQVEVVGIFGIGATRVRAQTGTCRGYSTVYMLDKPGVPAGRRWSDYRGVAVLVNKGACQAFQSSAKVSSAISGTCTSNATVYSIRWELVE